MKNLLNGLALVLLCGLACPAFANTYSELYEYGLKMDNNTFVSSGDGPPVAIQGQQNGFDSYTGLGILTFHVAQSGPHYLGLFLDHQFDTVVENGNTSFNEYGAVSGIADSRQSWEIDEPGFVFGDIFEHIQNKALDNKNGVPESGPDDVSMALGWDFVLGADEHADILFVVSKEQPGSGFYLQQTDPDSQKSLYFYSTLQIGENRVPELVNSFAILLSALGTLAWIRKRTSR